MVLGTVCSNLLSTFDLVGKCQLYAFNESVDNSHGLSYIDRFTCIMLGHVLETISNRNFLTVQNK